MTMSRLSTFKIFSSSSKNKGGEKAPPPPPPKDPLYLASLRNGSTSALSVMSSVSRLGGGGASPMPQFRDGVLSVGGSDGLSRSGSTTTGTEESGSSEMVAAGKRARGGVFSKMRNKKKVKKAKSLRSLSMEDDDGDFEKVEMEFGMQADPDENISMPWNFQHNVHVDEGYSGLPPSWHARLVKAGFTPEEIQSIQARRTAPPTPAPQTLFPSSTSASRPASPAIPGHQITTQPSQSSMSSAVVKPRPRNSSLPSRKHSDASSIRSDLSSNISMSEQSPQDRMGGRPRPSPPPPIPLPLHSGTSNGSLRDVNGAKPHLHHTRNETSTSSHSFGSMHHQQQSPHRSPSPSSSTTNTYTFIQSHQQTHVRNPTASSSTSFGSSLNQQYNNPHQDPETGTGRPQSPSSSSSSSSSVSAQEHSPPRRAPSTRGRNRASHHIPLPPRLSIHTETFDALGEDWSQSLLSSALSIDEETGTEKRFEPRSGWRDTVVPASQSYGNRDTLKPAPRPLDLYVAEGEGDDEDEEEDGRRGTVIMPKSGMEPPMSAVVSASSLMSSSADGAKAPDDLVDPPTSQPLALPLPTPFASSVSPASTSASSPASPPETQAYQTPEPIASRVITRGRANTTTTSPTTSIPQHSKAPTAAKIAPLASFPPPQKPPPLPLPPVVSNATPSSASSRTTASPAPQQPLPPPPRPPPTAPGKQSNHMSMGSIGSISRGRTPPPMKPPPVTELPLPPPPEPLVPLPLLPPPDNKKSPPPALEVHQGPERLSAIDGTKSPLWAEVVQLVRDDKEADTQEDSDSDYGEEEQGERCHPASSPSTTLPTPSTSTTLSSLSSATSPSLSNTPSHSPALAEYYSPVLPLSPRGLERHDQLIQQPIPTIAIPTSLTEGTSDFDRTWNQLGAPDRTSYLSTSPSSDVATIRVRDGPGAGLDGGQHGKVRGDRVLSFSSYYGSDATGDEQLSHDESREERLSGGSFHSDDFEDEGEVVIVTGERRNVNVRDVVWGKPTGASDQVNVKSTIPGENTNLLAVQPRPMIRISTPTIPNTPPANVEYLPVPSPTSTISPPALSSTSSLSSSTSLTPSSRLPGGWLSKLASPVEPFLEHKVDPTEYYVDLTEIGQGESGFVYVALVNPPCLSVAVERRDEEEVERKMGQLTKLSTLKKALDVDCLMKGVERVIAIKIVNLSPAMTTTKGTAEEKKIENVAHELELLKGLPSHLNILTVDSVYLHSAGNVEEEASLWIRMDLMERSLADIISLIPHGLVVVERLIARFISDALAGLEFLHERGVVHLDVRSDNLMVDREGVVKLGEFECARRIGDAMIEETEVARRFGGCGVVFWQAPEVRGVGVGIGGASGFVDIFKADSYSLGSTLWELSSGTGHPPYHDDPYTALGAKGYPTMPSPQKRLYTPAFWEFLEGCGKTSSAERLSSKALRGLGFVREGACCGRGVVVQLLSQAVSIEEELAKAEEEEQGDEEGI